MGRHRRGDSHGDLARGFPAVLRLARLELVFKPIAALPPESARSVWSQFEVPLVSHCQTVSQTVAKRRRRWLPAGRGLRAERPTISASHVNCRGFTILLSFPSLRVVAQFGSAFDWGSPSCVRRGVADVRGSALFSGKSDEHPARADTLAARFAPSLKWLRDPPRDPRDSITFPHKRLGLGQRLARPVWDGVTT